MATDSAPCSSCSRKGPHRHEWVERTITVRVDEGLYGSSPDMEDFAYLLRMGGIDAEVVD